MANGEVIAYIKFWDGKVGNFVKQMRCEAQLAVNVLSPFRPLKLCPNSSWRSMEQGSGIVKEMDFFLWTCK